MKTNDIKKGMKVLLANGWHAEIMDNKKGNTRLAKVYGDFIDIGSVYSHDIVQVLTPERWVEVEHTPAQLKLKKTVDKFFGIPVVSV